MPKEVKVRIVEDLSQRLSESSLVVLTDYRGLTVAEMATLRGRLREQGVEYHVAKNTLLTIAAEKVGRSALREALVGPTAVAYTRGDESALAKALGDYERMSKVFKIKAGLLGHRLLSPGDIGVLANLPSRQILLSHVVAGVQAPLAGLVGVLGGLMGGLVGTLEARRQQLEEQAGSAS